MVPSTKASMEAPLNFLKELQRIPNEEKRAYLQALFQCPQLLHRESCVERFLHYVPKQVDKAAKKFVEYWEKRRQVYGDDAAFSPLHVSEPSVLSESCKALLRAGWISPLPPDKFGHRVCLLNLTVERNSPQVTQEDKARCVFFVLQCLSEDRAAQENGMSLVVVYDTIPHTSPDTSIKHLDDILQVIPVRVMSLHVIHAGEDEGDVSFYENFVPVALKTLLNSPVDDDHDILLEQRSQIHVNKTRKEVLNALEHCGFCRERLPAIVGGQWTALHHEAWLKVRMEEELHRTIRPTVMPTLSFPGKESTTGQAAVGEVREKLRDAWHSKLKRTRKRCRTKALQIRVAQLRNQKSKANELNLKLEKALKEAKRIVETIGEHEKRLTVAVSSSPAIHPPKAAMYASSGAVPPSRPYPEEVHAPMIHVSVVSTDAYNMAVRAEQDMLFLAALCRPRSMPAIHSPVGAGLYGGGLHHHHHHPQVPLAYPPSIPLHSLRNESSATRRYSLVTADNEQFGGPWPYEWNRRWF